MSINNYLSDRYDTVGLRIGMIEVLKECDFRKYDDYWDKRDKYNAPLLRMWTLKSFDDVIRWLDSN